MIALFDMLPDLQAALDSKNCGSAKDLLQQVFPGMDDKNLVKAIVSLADSARTKDHIDRAVKYYRLAIDLQERCLPTAEMAARHAKHALIEILKANNEHDEAKRLADELRL